MKLAAGFGLTPERIVRWFESKELRVTWSWREMSGEEHKAAFTIAKMMDMELLETVQEKVARAIEDGWSLEQFQRELYPILAQAGWWGEQVITDPNTGLATTVQTGSTARLETIFRTNMQTAYSQGHWEAIQRQKDIAPWLLYDAVDDARTRPEHAALDGFVAQADDPVWNTIAPPSGFNCRCGLLQLDDEELADLGYQPATSAEGITVDEGWDFNPGAARADNLVEVYNDKLTEHPAAPSHSELMEQAGDGP